MREVIILTNMLSIHSRTSVFFYASSLLCPWYADFSERGAETGLFGRVRPSFSLVILVMVKGGRVYSCHAWPQSYGHRPSHPCHAGTEHVGFSPTRQTLLAPGTKRP